MKKGFKILLVSTLTMMSTTFIQIPGAQAQCPMCRLSVEANLKDGGTGGKGLNAGILFMLSLPYLIVGSLGYVWWQRESSLVEDKGVEMD